MLKKLIVALVCALCLTSFFGGVFRSGSVSLSDELTDVSEFVIGTFREEGGGSWHFDGVSEVRIKTEEGTSYGYYHFLEDTRGRAVIMMGLNGVTEVYEFSLDSSEGCFTMSCSNVEYSFTPVHIR